MSTKELTDTAIKHLYAGELLRRLAVEVSTVAEHASDEQLKALVQVKEMLIAYAQSELTVTQGLCEIAEAQKGEAPC